jgi:molybdopterin-containing oxidoreductase family iron-sulfur binding subunit
VIRDWQAHRGRALVHVGPGQPPSMHAIVHAVNAALGGPGNTLLYVEPVEAVPTIQCESVQTLVEDMRAGRVDTLVTFGGNPVFTAHADLDFPGALQRVAFSVG